MNQTTVTLQTYSNGLIKIQLGKIIITSKHKIKVIEKLAEYLNYKKNSSLKSMNIAPIIYRLRCF